MSSILPPYSGHGRLPNGPGPMPGPPIGSLGLIATNGASESEVPQISTKLPDILAIKQEHPSPQMPLFDSVSKVNVDNDNSGTENEVKLEEPVKKNTNIAIDFTNSFKKDNKHSMSIGGLLNN